MGRFITAKTLEELKEPDAFRRFHLLLNRQSLLPPDQSPETRSLLDDLLSESKEVGEEITRILYGEYMADTN